MLIAQSASKLYDGEPLTRGTNVLVKGLPEMFSAEVTVEGAQTDAGSSPNRVTGYVIRNPYGEDVTAHFSHIETMDGTLIVHPAPVTILTGSAQKAYDGQPLICDETDVIGFIRGDSPEADQNIGFAAEDEAGSGSLYVLCGIVRVFGCNPLTGETDLVEVPAGQRIYAMLNREGGGRSIRFVLQPVAEKDLPDALLRFLAVHNDLLAHVCEETGWDQAVIKARIQALPDGLTLYTGDEDRIIENCANVQIMVDTAVTEYSGAALSLSEISYTNIRNEKSFQVKATGSQTKVGESPNTYVIDWGSDDPNNYAVSEQLGTLTVTPCEHKEKKETAAYATCISTGWIKSTCVLCGEVFTQDLPLDPTNHTGGTSILRAVTATCTENGYSGDTVCLGCGAVLRIGQVTPKNPDNHTGGKGLQNAETATCAEEGYSGDTVCLGCGAVLRIGQATPKNPDNHIGGKGLRNDEMATCAEEGYSGDTVCLGCGAVLRIGQATPKNPGNHTGGTELRNIKTATCAEEGYSGDTVCLGCGAVLRAGQAMPKDPGNHAGGTEIRNVQTATCAEEGYSGDMVCLGCGAVLRAGQAMPKDPGNHGGGTELRNVQTATCAEEGYSGDTVCLGCGAVLSIGQTTPKDPGNHTGGTVILNEYEATCAEKGYSGDTVCLRCGTVVSAGTSIPVDQNNHVGGTVIMNYQAPTCVSPGYSGDAYCSACGALLAVGSALSTDMSNHASPVVGYGYEPTCTSPGFTGETYCAACGTFISGGTTIPELGHNWVYDFPVYRCTRCGQVSKVLP